jgi:predicted metal-dependent enzyme (double-stranded beta helix superfamily)
MTGFLAVIIVIIYLLFGAAFAYLTLSWAEKRRAHKKFFTALDNVVQQAATTSEQMRQVNLHFKKLAENNRYVSSELRGPEDLIEQFIHILDTGNEEYLQRLHLNVSPDARVKVLALLDEMRKENPFSSLPSKEANAMSALDQAVAAKNVALSKQLIRQIAQEMEKTHNVLRAQERRNRISYTISAVGVVLTTFFGILYLILML